jgi:hypothetical protein
MGPKFFERLARLPGCIRRARLETKSSFSLHILVQVVGYAVCRIRGLSMNSGAPVKACLL